MSFDSNAATSSTSQGSSYSVYRTPGSTNSAPITNPSAKAGQIRQIQPRTSSATNSPMPLPQAGPTAYSGTMYTQSRGSIGLMSNPSAQTTRITNTGSAAPTSQGGVTTTVSAIRKPSTTDEGKVTTVSQMNLGRGTSHTHHGSGNIQQIVPGAGRGQPLTFGGGRGGPVYRKPE